MNPEDYATPFQDPKTHISPEELMKLEHLNAEAEGSLEALKKEYDEAIQESYILHIQTATINQLIAELAKKLEVNQESMDSKFQRVAELKELADWAGWTSEEGQDDE